MTIRSVCVFNKQKFQELKRILLRFSSILTISLRPCLVLFVVMLSSSTMAINLSMPSIFADHMVLQRGQNVPVWGITDAKAQVEVVFAGQKKVTKADANGKWRIDLNPMKASKESRIMRVSASLNGKSKELKILDVLVGEVWLAGGQSNMYRPFRMLIGKAVDPKYEPIAEYLRNEAATANDPLFRQFRVGREHSVFEEKTQGRGKWSKAVPGDVNEFCGTAYFFARELRRELNVPVALLSCNLGATRVEPWIPMGAYQKTDTLKTYYEEQINLHKKQLKSWNQEKEDDKYKLELAEWQTKANEAKQNGGKEPRKPEAPNRDKQVPSTLYNAMIHPMIPYAIKGAIWYQGESNQNSYPEQYAMRLSAMIEGWREAWGQNKLFFYYCQLANYKKVNSEPLEETDSWVIVQDQQRRALTIPDAGMAVLNDIGEAKDIHPKNKVDAGKRLSLWAMKQAYRKHIVCSGPIYKSSVIKGNKVLITFDYAGSGLMVGKKHLMEPTVQVEEPLQRFQICGSDRQWEWAKAKIIGQNKVEVWHEDIQDPEEVRYAWSPNPEGANLYNKEGLPASLFKTKN